MNKKFRKFNYTILIQESFVSPRLNFGVDISKDSFIYTVHPQFSVDDKTRKEVFLLDETTLAFENPDLIIGAYTHELLWVRNGIERVVFQGTIDVVDQVEKHTTATDFTITLIDETIDVTIEFSESVINQGPQGLPGKDFTFEDFTEEQLEILQQPAIDVAERASIAVDKVDEIVLQANEKIEVVTTAIENANVKAELANSAAITANEKATLANNAATNANEKATLANNAATSATNAAQVANSAKGWTPIHHFESDGATRQIQKLVDYIGGSGTKPTVNIGRYVLDNGYTDNKSLATNFKGEQSGNLIAEYVHSGNKEVHVTSVDLESGTFTCENHGLTNGQRVTAILNKGSVNGSHSAYYVYPYGLGEALYYVVQSDANTFKVSATNNGVPLTFTDSQPYNLTKWHFEVPSSITNINFNGLPSLINVNIKLSAKFLTSTYFYINGANIGSVLKTTNGESQTLTNYYATMDIQKCHWGMLNVELNHRDIIIREYKGNLVRYNPSSGNYTITSINQFASTNISAGVITSLSLGIGYAIANGCVIQIFKA